MPAEACDAARSQPRPHWVLDALARAVRGLLSSVQLSCHAPTPVLPCSKSAVWNWWDRSRKLLAGEPIRRPGRQVEIVDVLVRNDIIAALSASGGRQTAELRKAYPDVPRAVLRSLQRRFRRLMKKRRRRGLATLDWQVPGAVWAMDHTDFQGGVEDAGRSVLVVRDLASGETLFAAPCGLDTASVCAVLERLIQQLGAPLVLKCDNGSGFVAEPTKLLLAAHGVLMLYSPPGTPSYNGSCEAGVGSIKHRAWDFAASRGSTRVDRNDLLMAQEQANTRCGDAAPPCRPALELLRIEVWRRYRAWESRLRKDRGLAPELELAHAEQASLDRFAVRKALTETAILMIRRRD